METDVSSREHAMNPWVGKRVIVTGATGFVGSNMVRKLLQQGATITALIRPGSDRWRVSDLSQDLTFFEGDLLDHDFVNKSFELSQPDFVYNFAFPAGYPIQEQARANMLAMGLVAVYNLLHASKHSAARFIQIGSSTEYGLRDVPHREQDEMRPVNIRGAAKAASTLLCRQFSSEFDFPVCILRLYAVYGPYEQPNRLIPRAIHAVLTGNELPLTPPGIVHDWIHVDDVTDACLLAGEQTLPPGEIVNIGSGEHTSNEEIVRRIEEVSGQTIHMIPSAFPPKPFDTSNWQADITKAKTLLHWTPKLSLTEGLESTLDFWKKKPKQLKI